MTHNIEVIVGYTKDGSPRMDLEVATDLYDDIRSSGSRSPSKAEEEWLAAHATELMDLSERWNDLRRTPAGRAALRAAIDEIDNTGDWDDQLRGYRAILDAAEQNLNPA